jgi:hypothetical protein
MTTLSAPDELRAKSAKPPSGPRLRVWRHGQPERTYPLADGKCTIGSSPRCRIRLPATEAQPLQCLVALESGAATVTRWAAGVLLNGREFSQCELHAGDQLTIGPWAIRWDAAGRPDDSLPRERDSGPPRAVGTPNSERGGNEPAPTSVRQAPTVSTGRQSPTSTPGGETKPQPELATTPPTASVPARGPAKTEQAASRPTISLAQPHRGSPSESASPAVETAVLIPPADLPLALRTNAQAGAPDWRHVGFSAANQAFEDRLLLAFWIDKSTAKRRVKSLAAAVRTARRRASELAAAVAAMESQGEFARTAAEAQSSRQMALLEASRGELQAALADRDRLAGELESLRQAPPSPAAPDPRLQTLADACATAESQAAQLSERLAASQSQANRLQEHVTAARQESAQLRQRLEASEQQVKALRDRGAEVEAAPVRLDQHELDSVREQLDASQQQVEQLRAAMAAAEAARADLEEQLTAQNRQQSQWLAECQVLDRDRAAALEAVVAERDELQRQLSEMEELAARPAPAATSDGPAAHAALREITENVATSLQDPWSMWNAAPLEERADQPTVQTSSWEAPPLEPQSPAAITESELLDRPDPRPANAEPAAQVSPVAPATRPRRADAEAPRVEVVETESTYTPTSFIDRYRHLLEENGDAEPSPRLSRPILDDEYLSPAKAELGDSPDEDSDEALEAYMSNLMRRVRGNATEEPIAPTFHISQALPATAAPADGARDDGAEPSMEASPDSGPTEFDANGLARLPRKLPATADLTALRELANTSARTAIAQHRLRRHAESAVSKTIICAMASGVSAYLMLTAPSIESPWFWGGCVTLVAAAGSAAQLLVLACRRWTERRRFRMLQAGSG